MGVSSLYAYLYKILKNLTKIGIQPRYSILIHYILYLVREGILKKEDIETTSEKFKMEFIDKLISNVLTK